MIRSLWFLLKVAILVGVCVWVAERPGRVVVNWQDYHLSMHLGLFLLGMLGTILLALFLYRVIRTFVDFPKSYQRFAELKRKDKGYKALTLGLTAVAAGDAKMANYHAHRARKFLADDDGLPLLLKAQSERLNGREAEARKSFAALLESKDAGFLGVRGLLQAALDSGNDEKALELARHALELHAKQPWILRIVYDLEVRQRLWDEARKTLYRAEKAGVIAPQKATSDRVAMYLAEGDRQLADGFRVQAMALYKKAYKQDSSFAPTILRLAKMHLQRAQRRAGVKLLEKAWKAEPHPAYVKLWGALAPVSSQKDPLAQLRWFEKLQALKPESAEGQMAAAQAALDRGLWGDARKYLEEAERLRPGPRVYRMLALLEEKSTHDEHKVRLWLEKAAEAAPEERWVCHQTGLIYEDWAPIAQPHGSFNTISWSYPLGYGASALEALPGGNVPMSEALIEAPQRALGRPD